MDTHGLVRSRGKSTPACAAHECDFPDLPRSSTAIISNNPVRRSIALLRKYVWTILACTVIAVSLCLLYAASQPRLYRATANIAIYRDSRADAPLGKDYRQEVGDSDDYSVSLETQLHILRSRTLAFEVIRKLGLDKDREFIADANPAIAAGSGAKWDNLPATLEGIEAADVLLYGLSVRVLKETRVVEVSFTGRKPARDAQIVNALVDVFIEDSIRSRFEASNRAATFLSGQLTGLRVKVEESQEKLVDYEREHNILGVDEKQNVVTVKLEDLNKQLTAAQADRIEKESLYQTIVAGSSDQIPETKASVALQDLRLREAELKSEFAQAGVTYGPNNPKVLELTNRVKAMDASIQAELKRMEGRAREEYQASTKREEKLRVVFAAQKNQANRMNESAIQYGLLKREVDSNRQLYENLQARMKEAGIAAGLRSSNIRLIDSAEPPMSPVSPNLPRSGYLGLFLGFLAGIAAVGIREGMDRSLRDPAEVESFTAMPSLAVIPKRHERKRMRLDDRGDIVCLSQPRTAIAEAYRALGTSVMLASPNLKTLLITSPLPGEGKTMSAANSAVVIAQQGKRVLLVDADLRKPALHRGFNLPNESGLSSVLLGQAEMERAIVCHERVPNLSLLTAGPAQSMPAEMLGSAKMQELMNCWRQQFDYVIIDTPPVLAVTDAVRLSSHADSVLVIIRSGQTTREALTRSCDLLNQARVPVLGIVVNGVSRDAAGSYYYGYYPELAKAYYYDEAPQR